MPSLLIVAALFLVIKRNLTVESFAPSLTGQCVPGLASGGVRPLRSRDSGESRGEDEDEDEDEDWRDFRARLVLGERRDDCSDSGATARDVADDGGSNSPRRKGWAYETGPLVERGSIILSRPRPNFGGGLLRHPFWHKAVMLILEHDERETLGIFLNRPSDRNATDETGKEWPVWYGGPVHPGVEFADENAEFICLHSIDSEAADGLSRKVMKKIKYSTFGEAKQLVRRGVANTDDFWVFAGYCGWKEGQLSDELENGDWITAASDSETILRELAGQAADNIDRRVAGLDTWNALMALLGRQSDIVADAFHDSLLKEWARDQLLLVPDEDGHEAVAFTGGDVIIRPGMMFRASSHPRSPYLLSDQDMHKSIFLVVSENIAGTVGVFLNLPSTKTIDVEVGTGDWTKEESVVSFVQRYGGSYVVFGEGERDVLLLHCNDRLRREGVGIPLDPKENGGVWECRPGDVISAVRNGCSPRDFMVVSGGFIWTKSVTGEAGGIRGQVWGGNFEPISHDRIQGVWDTLLEQEAMTAENVNRNIDTGLSAWR